MYNNRLVWIVISAAALEILSFLVLTILHLNGTVDFNDFALYAEVISVGLALPFFIILLKYQYNQQRYLMLSIFSIITLLAHLLFFVTNNEMAINFRVIADLTFVGAVAVLITSVYVGVDDGTYRNVKRIFVANAFWLIMYKTPVLIVATVLLAEMFRGVDNMYEIVYVVFIIFQFIFALIINIFKVTIVNRIDFV